MNITEQENCACYTRRPGDSSQNRDRWACNHFSLSPASQAKLRALREAGSPNSRGLERLREKIHQQRLCAKSAMTPDDPPLAPVPLRGQITRKTCRVTFDPPLPAPTLGGLSAMGVKSISYHNNPPRSMIPPSTEKSDGGKANSVQTDVEGHSDTHPVKEAQPGLGPHPKALPLPMQRKTSAPHRTGGKQILVPKPCRPMLRGRLPAPGISSRNFQKTKVSTTTRKIAPSKRNAPLKSPISTPGSPNNRMPKSPSVRTIGRSHSQSKVPCCGSPSPTVHTQSPVGPASGLEEDRGSERTQGPQRSGVQEVRKFMGQKEKERRRREQQKKEEAQRQEEQRKARVREVLRKQRMALSRAKSQPRNGPQANQGAGVTGPEQKQELSHCGRGRMIRRCVWQGKGGSKVEPVPCLPGGGPSRGGGGAGPGESRAQRVTALRQAAADLETRVEEEAARLRASASLPLSPASGSTGPAGRPDRWSGSASISKDLPWDPPVELEDTEDMVSSPTAATICSGVGVQGSEVAFPRPSGPSRTAQQSQTPTEDSFTVPDVDAVEELPLEEGRVTPQSKHSSSSENTDSTSKWSELSCFFGRGDLLSRLSLAMFRQSLRDEELRARHHSALCRLREEALREKTRTEIAWLEHRCRCLRAGEEGTLADITQKQEEVVNRLRQEQAEIRHWQNLHRSGRQHRKLLLRQQREVLEIRRSADRLQQQLQEQGWAEPQRIPPSQDVGRSQETGGPEATPPVLGNPPRAWPHGPRRVGAAGTSSEGWASLQGGHGLHRSREDRENDIENKKRSIPGKPAGDMHTDTKHLKIQRGRASQSSSKNSRDPVSHREQENGAGVSKPDLSEGEVLQISLTAGQNRNVPAAKPGVAAGVKAGCKPSEEEDGSLKTKAPGDGRRLGRGTFSVTTDAGSRRIPPTEDVWNWGRRSSVSVEMAPAEQGELRTPLCGYPGPSVTRVKNGQLPPQKSIQTEGRSRGEEEEGLNLTETMVTTVTQPHPDYPTAFASKGRPQTLRPPAVEEESGFPERVSPEEESGSDESSSSGGPLRVRSLPDFTEVSWKSQRSVGSFASLPEFQRVPAACMNVLAMSGPSSDTEEDLPLDVEDSGWGPAGRRREGDQEQSSEATYKPHAFLVGEPKKAMGNALAFNVRNDQRSKSTLTSNNNCEIIPSSCTTVAEDCSGICLQAGTAPGLPNSGPSAEPGSPGPDGRSRDTESSSADCSLSETEDGSDVLSFSSECLISSGEEDSDEPNLSPEAHAEEQGHPHPSHPSGSGASSYKYHETPTASLDERQPIPEVRTSEREYEKNNPGSFVSPRKPPASEEALSEILSPVDEVLSYGSTELPPTVTDDLMLPPAPPACEVITWTSEDGLPAPPEELCEPLPVEDPSIKSDDLPSLSDDPLLPGSTALPTGLTDRLCNNGDCLKVDQLTTGYTVVQRSWEGQAKEDVKSALSTAEEDENSNSTDPLSSFRIGDRVLVCRSRPGQLRFKGVTSFASGHWAGVALDHPSGNHDGMFRGVRYFQCSKNCGVLVRAEDISRLLSEQESDQETRADDPFSDEEPPSTAKPPQDGWVESTGKPSGMTEEWCRSQGGERSGGAGGHSLASQMSSNSFSREPNNNPLYSPTSAHEGEVRAPERSAPKSPCRGLDPSIHEAHWKEDIYLESHQQQQGLLEAEGKESCPDLENSMSLTGNLRRCEEPNDLWHGGGPGSCLKGLPEMRPDTAPAFLEPSARQTPLDCSGSPLGKSERGDQLTACADPEEGWVHPGGRCVPNVDSLVDSLMGKLLMEVVTESEERRRKSRGKRSTGPKENHIQSPQAVGKRDGGPVKPSLNPSSTLRPGPPCFSDQWRCSVATVARPRARVRPHDPPVVRRLVAESVEVLCGQTRGCVTDSTEAPAYLASEESRRAYRQVIFDLTSDIYRKALRCGRETSTSPWELKEASSVSPFWSSKSSLTNIKATIQSEVQRELNLERTDVQTEEMMQKLCKYRTAHRDRVDYVLIQELQKEEQQWVDYSLDQLNVKMQLTEEIFDILLQDTISVLNHIYAAPSVDGPPVLQPSQSSLTP